jgi:predicted metal-dependent HD superfamily phosphohydrolase
MSDIRLLLPQAEIFAKESLARYGNPNLQFHTVTHTEQVVEAVKEIATASQLSQQEIDPILLAAWFHDLGYTRVYEGHETESQRIATEFLTQAGLPQEQIDEVNRLIEVTRLDVEPVNLPEQIIKDADLSNLATDEALDHTDRLRIEWMAFLNRTYTDEEWYTLNLKFYQSHAYYTPYAQENFAAKKQENIQRMEENLREAIKKKKKLKKKKLEKLLEKEVQRRDKRIAKLQLKLAEAKEQKPDRGIETMFRSTYRTHISLSSIADNKANILLSINSIIISILGSSILSSGLEGLSEYVAMIFPIITLGLTCILTIVFAILSTRPSVSSGTFTREDILQKRTNLLFFGNFHSMPLNDYLWGISEMMKDSDYLYGSMSKDIYFLGVVLAKKFKLLRTAYTIFMYGMVVTVVFLGLAIFAKMGG